MAYLRFDRTKWIWVAAVVGFLIARVLPPVKPDRSTSFVFSSTIWAGAICPVTVASFAKHLASINLGEGMLFTSAYAAAPLCSATRASLLTGRYPARSALHRRYDLSTTWSHSSIIYQNAEWSHHP